MSGQNVRHGLHGEGSIAFLTRPLFNLGISELQARLQWPNLLPDNFNETSPADDDYNCAPTLLETRRTGGGPAIGATTIGLQLLLELRPFRHLRLHSKCCIT